MNRFLLLTVVFVLALTGTIFGPALSKVEGAIVYSGSQNVTLQLKGGPNLPAPPAEMAMISIAGSGEKWDDFTIILEYELGMMGMPGMTMGMTRLTILGSMGLGMGMGEVVGLDMMGMGRALNLAPGALIGPELPLADRGLAVLLSEGMGGRTTNGEFGASGGYIGLVLPGSAYYAWLRLSNMSNVGANNQSVTFGGWAYEDAAGTPIGAGDTGPGPGPCGWQPGDQHKMHFPQLPDPQGWDVDVMYANILADDWKCSATGPIKDIHFWYSWLGDKVGIITNIRASIWSNIPAEDRPGSYSKPGKVLWKRDFRPDQLHICYWGSGNQGFMMGNEGRANDHKQIFQCNIVNIADPYVQQQGRIYWLALSAWIQDPVGTHIGWKTSKDHFEDDAVHGSPDGLWQEMRDPLTRESLDLAFVITGEEQPEEPKCDLGDAPDSSNTVGVQMTAYPKGGPPGVPAKYPTVYGAGSPPYGPIHWQPKAVAYLGDGVSLENEADSGTDEDGTNNIVPPNDSPDLDKADDGVQVPLVLPYCQQTSFVYRVTVVPLATIEPPPLYVNVWFDWNRDGDWNDVLLCPDGTQVREWAVQNQLLQFVTSGTYDVTTPAFTCWQPQAVPAEEHIWMRITLSEKQWGMVTSVARAGGDGPAAGYEFGETEDYYFTPEVEVPPEPKPPAEHLKWSQPPIEWDSMSKTPLYCGWNEPSFCIKPTVVPGAVDPAFWSIVADDFRCLGNMPVTSIHWWGSYEGWTGREPPETKPFAWQIGFWSNVPANPDAKPPFSHPGRLLWQMEIPPDRVHEEWAGIDRFPQKPSDSCFQYYVELKPREYFLQQKYVDSATRDDVFWLSITAIYPPILIPYNQWGWKTRPQHWMDDAVRFEVQGELPTGFSNEFGIEELTSTSCGEKQSYDMAFELDTDPNYIKWEQAYTGIRDWPHYADEESLAFALATDGQKQQLQIRRLVADDWLCTRITPVTAVVWWGSYIGYQYEACQCQQMAPPAKPDYFLLSIWTDVPTSADVPYSRPGEKVWEYKAYDYDEVLVGYDKHPEYTILIYPPPPVRREPVFRYSVQLPKENWFCQKNVNAVYWLSIVAVYKNPQEVRYPWGWTNHKCTTWEPPGLAEVLHWKLDETAGVTASDDSGNNNHGTLVGDANWTACCGHVCGALDLDGKGDYVKVDAPTGLNFAPGSFSASAWVKAREVTGGWRTIMEYDRDGWERNRFGMWLTEDGRFHFRVGWNAWQTNQKLNVDQWYMLTGTYDSKTKKFSMYVNGQFDIAADLQKGFTSANVAKLTVGVRGSEDSEYFNGLIDDVRIYNYALSADQVKVLYDASRNDDAVAGHMVTDTTGASTWVWEELHDQLGMSEDMSFILFTEPGCFPCTYSTYGDWLAFGKPDCWCARPNGSGYQCDGDADGKDSGGINKFRVFTGDLTLIVANWKKKAGDATLDPCADIDHKDSSGILKFRVFTGDLARLVTNWKKKDTQLPGDCPRPE